MILESVNDDVTILALDGQLNAQTSSKLEEHIQNVLGQERRRIIIDLDRVAYVSSAGIRVFLMAARRLQPDGTLVLARAKSMVEKVLAMTNFEKISPMTDDLDKALELCRSNPA